MHILLAAALFLASPLALKVPLTFDPQEGIEANNASIHAEARNTPIEVLVEDARGGEPLTIGAGSDDDDDVFDIVATSDPVAFVRTNTHRVAKGWRVPLKEGADRTLHLRLMEFDVEESNKAVGSIYIATVAFRYSLMSGRDVLMEGSVTGTAERFGRSASARNCNEVLSDALKDALAQIFDSSDVQKSWISGKPAPRDADADDEGTIEERLRKLEELYSKGVITKDEYDTKRADILSEL
jgi:hypothetical protein